MPDRKIVPCSRTYLSSSVVSGRLSLTGAVDVNVPAAISVPANALSLQAAAVIALDRNGSGDLTSCQRQKEVRHRADERARGLLLPRALELAEVLVHDRLDLAEVAGAHGGQRALVDVDRPLGHQRQVHRHVAGDLEAADERAHELLDRRVRRRAGEREVELDVELQE